MLPRLALLVASLLLTFPPGDAWAGQRRPVQVWPGTTWTAATPASQGMDETQLTAARDFALTGGGAGMVVRRGHLVMQWGDPAQRFALKSTTKSIGAALLGLAIGDGLIGLGDSASAHHPSFGVPPDSNLVTGWTGQISVRHLATHTAGFDVSGGYTALLFAPGSEWFYSDGGPNWIAEMLTLAYGRDLLGLLFDRILTPMNLDGADLTWRTNAYRPSTIEGIERREFGSGMSANVDALARIGLLFLRRGRWQGQQILPAHFVDAVRTPQQGVVPVPERDPGAHGDASLHYGLLWWNNADGALPGVPRDAHWSWGLGESLIVVIPSLDIVAARAGGAWQTGWKPDYAVVAPFLEPISASVAWPASYACADGLDNDGDGLVDGTEDPGCQSIFSPHENPACDDFVDNDGDGGVDWGRPGAPVPADPQCAGLPHGASE